MIGCDVGNKWDLQYPLNSKTAPEGNVLRFESLINGKAAFRAEFKETGVYEEYMMLSNVMKPQGVNNWPVNGNTHFVYAVIMQRSDGLNFRKLYYLNGYDTCFLQLKDVFPTTSYKTQVIAYHIKGT